MYQQPIANIMTRTLSRASQNDSVSDIINELAQQRRSCVVVCNGDLPVGIITERDIINLLANHPNSYRQHLAADIMTAPPVTVFEDTEVIYALELASARRLRHLVVTNADGLLQGIVTQTDMVQSYLTTIQNVENTVATEVKGRTQALEASNQALLDLAMEDSLMGIGNRRAMEIDLQHTQSGAERYGETFCVALLDVDLFKPFNDRYGHQAGDNALRKIAEVLKAQLRESDRIYRYGGEEILLLMPKTTLLQAKEIAQRAITAIAQAGIQHEDSPNQVLTASGGVALGGETWQQGLKAADEALYQAKKTGRNKICAADS